MRQPESRRGVGGVAEGRRWQDMSLWIKICANTSLEDAKLAAEAGATRWASSLRQARGV